jgi:hypothetical protein
LIKLIYFLKKSTLSSVFLASHVHIFNILPAVFLAPLDEKNIIKERTVIEKKIQPIVSVSFLVCKQLTSHGVPTVYTQVNMIGVINDIINKTRELTELELAPNESKNPILIFDYKKFFS